MKPSPYLDELLKKWGRALHAAKPWYDETPYLKQHIGRTSRTPIFSTEGDEVENLARCIEDMADPLRKALEARYRCRLETLKAKSSFCRCSGSEYNSYFREAIKHLESMVNVKIAI